VIGAVQNQSPSLPPIPAKRYFTIGEVSELCGVKPHVLRYWEQEFTQLRPMKRRGNRRYYQHHEVVLVRRIRDLLYEQGFTISGARNRLGEYAAGRLTGLAPTSSTQEALAQGACVRVFEARVAAARAELLTALALLSEAPILDSPCSHTV
jgi:DNA-binding transcriptional MerR regulator